MSTETEQAKKLLQEIKRKEAAITQTKSWKLKRDYQKSIYKQRRELAEYCKIRGISISLIE